MYSPQWFGRIARPSLGCTIALLIALTGCRPALPEKTITILAPDVVIHLGDDTSPPAGWVPLFNRLIPSLEWRADFFVPDSRGAWELSALIQAGRESTSKVLLNNWYVYPGFTTLTETGDASTWRTITATVPIGVLRPGPNEILVRTGLHPPYRQVTGDIWDDFQIRDVRVTPAFSRSGRLRRRSSRRRPSGPRRRTRSGGPIVVQIAECG